MPLTSAPNPVSAVVPNPVLIAALSPTTADLSRADMLSARSMVTTALVGGGRNILIKRGSARDHHPGIPSTEALRATPASRITRERTAEGRGIKAGMGAMVTVAGTGQAVTSGEASGGSAVVGAGAGSARPEGATVPSPMAWA